MMACSSPRAKKKKKNNKIEDEVPHELEEPDLGITEEEEKDKARLEATHKKRHQGLAAEMSKDLSSLPALGKASDVMKEAADQRKAIEGLVAKIDDTLKTVKVARPKNINTGKIMESIREMRLCKDDGVLSKETKKDMISDYQEALSKSLAWESFRNFQAEMNVLRAECEARLKTNAEALTASKSESGAKKLQQRVAIAKGVSLEEISELVSINTDVTGEVGSALFIFQRRFEKQFGVVIDRPEAAKGAGKGDAKASPPKTLIVRGVQADVSECLKALKAIDMTSKTAITVNSRQAAAIMGQQQANARKIEKDFKGVFIHSEKGEVRIFGSKKAVAECEKHIQTVMAEVDAGGGPNVDAGDIPGKASGKGKGKPPSLSITIDADKARALIGVGGKSIQKIETDTDSKIKVNIPPKETNEDNKATVRVSGEPANSEKGLAKVKDFVEKLQATLVEGDSDAISRLYDSTRKGKGKGKGGGAQIAGSAKFTELRESSGLTVVRKPKGILLLGERAEVFKWKSVLAACIEEAGVVPEPPYSDTMEDVPKDGLRSLTARGAAKLKEIEQKHDVSIGIDRKTSIVKITGPEDKVELAKKDIVAATSTPAGESMEIEIEWDEGKIIIGRGGSTVRQIKEACGLNDLQIRDNEENKTVILRGSEEAIAKGKEMVQETLANAKKAREEGGYTEDRPAKKEPRAKKAEATDEGSPAPTKAAAKARPKQEKPELESQEVFPTLGGSGAQAPKKGGAWGEKKEGARETEADAPESFPALGDDGNDDAEA